MGPICIHDIKVACENDLIQEKTYEPNKPPSTLKGWQFESVVSPSLFRAVH